MPTFRKVSPCEAAAWRTPGPRRVAVPNPAELAQLKAQLADARGITRIDLAGRGGGEHAWRARVYTRNIEVRKQFTDSVYGGPAAALRAAIAWRDGMRQLAGPRQRRGSTPRVVRAEYGRDLGWIAYTRWKRRYFADAAWGGREAARATAEQWMNDEGRT